MSGASWLLAAFAALIFSLYALSISPSIAGGDSGELVAEGCILGTAHPPGYPVFTLMVYGLKVLGEKLGFSLEPGSVEAAIPAGNNVAFSVNVVSCLFTVGAAYLIGEMVLMAVPTSLPKTSPSSSPSLRNLGGAMLGMGMFAFSPLIWQYAVTAEVFPMNTFFAALIVYLVLLFSKTRRFGVALCGAFVCGLALCNQHTIILYEAPLVLWMLFLLRNRILFAKDGYACLALLSAAFLLGLTPYAYLPVSANWFPDSKWMSWGHVATLQGFLHHFLRRDYGTFQLFSGESGKSAEGFWVRSSAYLEDVGKTQGLYFAPWLALVAIVCWRRVYFLESDGEKLSVAGAAAAVAVNKRDKQSKNNKHTNNKTGTADGGTTTTDSGDESSISAKEANYTPAVLMATQFFYFAVFHNLANLPMGDKLLFGVHQRFWMQPNVMTFMLAGVGFNELLRLLAAVAGGGKGSNSSGSGKLPLALTATSAAEYCPNKIWTSAVSILVAAAAVYYQYTTHLPISDQHDAFYFRDYARAILTPLPQNSLLIVNYDMQWTSLRYLTQCEGFRSDVTTINLSMMTYEWFKHKRGLYPDLAFPGSHCAAPNTVIVVRGDEDGVRAFTLEQFIAANVHQHPIFIGGKVSHPDPKLDAEYDFVPVGLVSRIVPKVSRPDAASFAQLTLGSWQGVLARLNRLPDLDKYTEETWEWTIGRDFKDRVVDVAAFALEGAIAADSAPIVNGHDLKAGTALVDATYWIECAVILESLESNASRAERDQTHGEPVSGRGRVPTSVLKNAGLAHMNLVRSKALAQEVVLPQPSADLFGTAQAMGWPVVPASATEGEKQSEEVMKSKYRYDWKGWSADRFMHHWGQFLTREDARQDPQYATIAQIHAQVKSAKDKIAGKAPQQQQQQQQQQASAAGAGEAEKKKKRKKKSSTPAAA
jgi:hypothetical protein